MSKNVAHITKNKVSLMGDSRGIVISYEKRSKVWEWAEKNMISIEYQGSLAGKDLWYIKNDQHRVWFMLRWS